MEKLRISLLQTDLVWKDTDKNLSRFSDILRGLNCKTDIAILPEMFTTGFSLDSENLAKDNDGNIIMSVKKFSKDFNFAITGSFLSTGDGKLHNRGFFIMPDGQEFYYDKRHLFSMAGEDKCFSSGNKRLTVNYKGWNICLMICYDLRFPVWSRNVGNEYDLLIYAANWPAARKDAWEALLKARAIENMSYVCGVNRVGIDNNGIKYAGGSHAFSPKGLEMVDCGENERIETFEIRKKELNDFRAKFPVWKDADRFEIY